MSKTARRLEKNAKEVKVVIPAATSTVPVTEVEIEHAFDECCPDAVSPEQLREEAKKLIAKAKALEKERADALAKKEAAEKAQREEEERERKAKEELERRKSMRRVYFTHNQDGTIDFNNPFFSANEAKFYDNDYIIVPSLVENDRYVRPLTKEEASGRHF